METKQQKDLWNAKFYKKNSQGQYDRGMSTIYEIDFRGDENVIDIGCGDGRITAEIAKKTPNGSVTGIDPSCSMITEANASFSDIKNLTFQCDYAETFSINEKADIIVSNSAFHWVKDQIKALKNIHNHLKQGGKLIIKMASLSNDPISEVYKYDKWSNILSNKPKTFFPQTIKTFMSMLTQCGFNNIDVKPSIKLQEYKSKEELFNFIFTWIPHLTGLPEEKSREFTHDVVNNICKTRKDNKIIFEIAGLNAYAIKPSLQQYVSQKHSDC